METINDEEGLTPAESASPATYSPGNKRNNKKGAPSLIRERKVIKKEHVTSPSAKVISYHNILEIICMENRQFVHS